MTDTPLDFAENQITALLRVHSEVMAGALPGFPPPLTAEAVARCILTELVAAVWTPPRWLAPWEPWPADIDPAAVVEYRAGIHPCDYAEGKAAALVSACTEALAGGGVSRGLPVTEDAFARRILGALLDAGWQPPVWPIPEPQPREAL